MRMEMQNIKILYQKLDSYCRYLSLDKWEREDLIQEALLKAMENYKDKDITPALLKKIADNQLIDKIRKKQDIIGIQVKEPKAEEKNLTSLMLAEFLAEKLTFKQGIVYLLVEGFQFRLKEVGELLNITETAVKSVLFRARNQVKKETIIVKNQHDEDKENMQRLYYEVLKREDPAILINSIYKNILLAKEEKKYLSQQPMLMAA
ncbi:sigma factor [Niallia sp. FSL R7-0648]|uniref:sigma factor n=1 Tax=Niallia TaxID=2837506 RepID=UPI0011A37110|nr:sigma factor [Niallia circulans]MCM2980423.1 hypothetical protein [Niallia circulans]